jgi:hypothetical protein
MYKFICSNNNYYNNNKQKKKKGVESGIAPGAESSRRSTKRHCYTRLTDTRKLNG